MLAVIVTDLLVHTESTLSVSVSPHGPMWTVVPALLISQGELRIKSEHGI